MMKKCFLLVFLFGRLVFSFADGKMNEEHLHQTIPREALRNAASHYITVLSKIGAPLNACRSEEILALCARGCKKVRNGKILFEGRDRFPSQLDVGKEWLGAWSIDVRELLVAEESKAVTIRYELSTEKEGDLVIIVILRFDSNYMISEINEVHNQLES